MNKKQFSIAAHRIRFDTAYCGRNKTMYVHPQDNQNEGDFSLANLLHEAGHTTFNIKYQKS